MKFQLQNSESGYTIHAYEAGQITINIPRAGGGTACQQQLSLERSIIISPQRLIDDWPPQCLEKLQADHLSTLTQLNPELVLLGTGSTIIFPPTELLAPLIEAGVGVEVMDSAAACRTFNLLSGDGRRVVAAILHR